MKIAYTGHLVDQTGFGEAARRTVQAIARAGGDVRPSPVRTLTDGGPSVDLSPWMQAFLDQTPHQKPDVEILHAIAAHFPEIPRSADSVIGFTCWETSALSQPMIDGCKSVDHVVVPSQHNRAIFEAAGFRTSLIPYPFDSGIDTVPIPALESLKCPHVFYTVASRQARKNLESLCVAFLTATLARDTALVIKVGGGPMVARQVADDVTRLKAILRLPERVAPVLVIGPVMDAQLRWLHHVKGTCYVSLSRGEGFGIPILDALMANRSIIAPDWGGSADLLYLKPQVPHMGVRIIASHLVPVVQDYPLFDGLQLWAEPDILCAQQAIRNEVLLPRTSRYLRPGTAYDPLTIGQAILKGLPRWISGS